MAEAEDDLTQLSRFDTMPSQPSAQACLKMIAPSPV